MRKNGTVLLAAPMQDGQTFPGIKFAFEQLGWKVYSVDAKIEPDKTYSEYNRIHPHLVICSRTPELTNEIKKIKENHEKSRVICYNTDKRPEMYYWEPLFELFSTVDYLLDPTPGQHEIFKEKLNKNTIKFPQGLQSELYHMADYIPRNISEYQQQVSFIGTYPSNFHKDRDEIIKHVSDNTDKFAVYTNMWGEAHNFICNPYVSKICLDVGIMTDIESYMSVRLYKILGAGGFALVKDSVGCHTLYPGGIFATYKDKYDCVDKIKYYLENEQERISIAQNGYDWVQTQTYKDRVRELLGRCFNNQRSK